MSRGSRVTAQFEKEIQKGKDELKEFVVDKLKKDWNFAGEETMSGATSSFSFYPPETANEIEMDFGLASDAAVTMKATGIAFNSDYVATNYHTSSGINNNLLLSVPGTQNTAGGAALSQGKIVLRRLTDTTCWKQLTCSYTNPATSTSMTFSNVAMMWKDTSVVTSVTIYVAGAKFARGTISVYYR